MLSPFGPRRCTDRTGAGRCRPSARARRRRGCPRCRCRGARRSRPPPRASGRAAPAHSARAMATLLKMQKPIARLRVAWWPGGRTAQNAFSSSPAITASVAASAAPAARSAASQVCGSCDVSGSMCAQPRRRPRPAGAAPRAARRGSRRACGRAPAPTGRAASGASRRSSATSSRLAISSGPRWRPAAAGTRGGPRPCRAAGNRGGCEIAGFVHGGASCGAGELWITVVTCYGSTTKTQNAPATSLTR